jgi:hypothetical protein
MADARPAEVSTTARYWPEPDDPPVVPDVFEPARFAPLP